eukprot:105776_1
MIEYLFPVFFVVGFTWELSDMTVDTSTLQRACTMDYGFCPDGATSSGRSGDMCEFSECPESLIVAKNGKCLDINANDDSYAILWDCHAGANQLFSFDLNTQQIRVGGPSGSHCLDIDTARVRSLECDAFKVTQKWYVSPEDVRIRSSGGNCLVVDLEDYWDASEDEYGGLIIDLNTQANGADIPIERCDWTSGDNTLEHWQFKWISAASAKQGLECPSSTFGRFGPDGNNDISGCGLEGCDARYEDNYATIINCEAGCNARADCVAYSWAPQMGDQNHKGHSVCTLYDSETPTQHWGPAQVMCQPNNFAPAQVIYPAPIDYTSQFKCSDFTVQECICSDFKVVARSSTWPCDCLFDRCPYAEEYYGGNYAHQVVYAEDMIIPNDSTIVVSQWFYWTVCVIAVLLIVNIGCMCHSYCGKTNGSSKGYNVVNSMDYDSEFVDEQSKLKV